MSVKSLCLRTMFLLMLAFCGCQYEYRADVVSSRNEIKTSTLGQQLREAFAGNREAARAYYGTYQVLADAVSSPHFGWKKPADIERDVIAVRELLNLRHQQFPEVTRLVTAQLTPLRENKDLTDQSRRAWQQSLQQLANGCREAAR